ncbi:Protein ALP1-like [Bienertia sinuspersici]
MAKNRVNEVNWNEQERPLTRATWINTLKNNRIYREEGLVTARNVTVKEKVALFLHILARDLKNRTIQAIYARSGETVGKYYIKQMDRITSVAEDNKWKWFEGFVGALDGTHIKMTVPIEDRPHYRDRKGDISTNVLATCDSELRFTYVLPGWEGSASDPRVLRDALRRPNGIRIPRSKVFNNANKYFLVDLGFSNCEGLLAPYKGTRYHLNLWRGNIPTNYMELFNLRHSSTRNTIERAFGLLKKHWSIIRDPSFFGKKTQIRIMNACFILHNFLREEKMEETSLMQEVEQDLLNMEAIDVEEEEDYILSARSTIEWNEFRDRLAKKMFEENNEFQKTWQRAYGSST